MLHTSPWCGRGQNLYTQLSPLLNPRYAPVKWRFAVCTMLSAHPLLCGYYYGILADSIYKINSLNFTTVAIMISFKSMNMHNYIIVGLMCFIGAKFVTFVVYAVKKKVYTHTICIVWLKGNFYWIHSRFVKKLHWYLGLHACTHSKYNLNCGCKNWEFQICFAKINMNAAEVMIYSYTLILYRKGAEIASD